jgi:molybdenum cofactor synthesis domain-containing protein
MRKIAIEDAVGQSLCHDLTAILETGFKGVRFKKEHIIRPEDLPVLRSMGKDHVFVWEPEVDEMHEDDCANALAQELISELISHSQPSEGKITLIGQVDGVLKINKSALANLNSVPDWTVTSLQDYQPITKNSNIAAFRIIPLVTKRDNVEKAVQIARQARQLGKPVFQVWPFQLMKVGIIITGNEIYEKRIPDAFEPILRKKLSRFPAFIDSVKFCPDDEKIILHTIQSLMDRDCRLILMTGGMSVDPDDVTPAAIRQSGATILMQGVPMQPGNMLTLAKKRGIIILGIPGASMHFPRTSLDVFLPRIFAGLIPTKTELAHLGVGGLMVPGYPLPWPTLPLADEEKAGFMI